MTSNESNQQQPSQSDAQAAASPQQQQLATSHAEPIKEPSRDIEKPGVASDKESNPREPGDDEKEKVNDARGEDENEKEKPPNGKVDPPEITITNENGERKFSMVSFREVCELYEIDLENGERNRQVIKSRPSVAESVRYYIMLLALISPFVTTYSRTIINFAITDMIDPRFIERQAEIHSSFHSANSSEVRAFDIDNSCPVDQHLRDRLNAENDKDKERASSTEGEKFEWDTVKQGYLKGAYAYGHAFFQIPGSRLSEIYGPHVIISINAILIGTCCLVAPFLASIHFNLIFVDLVLLGILGSFMTPAAMTLYSNWLTPGEKALMVSFTMVGSRLGYALSSFLCGRLLEAGTSWRYVFYSSGWVGLSFGLVFFLVARNRPKDHPFVSQLELEYLATKNTLVRESLREDENSLGRKLELKQVVMLPNGQVQEDLDPPSGRSNHQPTNDDDEDDDVSTKDSKRRKKNGAPWLALATSTPVWAFVVTKFCVKFAGDTAQIELPSYLKRVMHFSAAENGNLNAWNYIIFCIGCIIVGALAKYITKKSPLGLSKTAIRKIFQCTASFGVGLILMGVAFSVCHPTSTQLLLLGFFFITTFGSGGEAQCPFDLSERYSGTIHAIGSSLAISGAIVPTIVGYFLRGRSADKDQWKYVWLGASAVSFIGGFVFLFFSEAKIQPFDSIGREEDGNSAEEKLREIPVDSGEDGVEEIEEEKLEEEVAAEKEQEKEKEQKQEEKNQSKEEDNEEKEESSEDADIENSLRNEKPSAPTNDEKLK